MQVQRGGGGGGGILPPPQNKRLLDMPVRNGFLSSMGHILTITSSLPPFPSVV